MANVPTTKPSLIRKFADKFSVEPEKMLKTLRDTAFKTKDPITNEQMMALLIVANEFSLNPFTKEIYAFPDSGGGIVPVVGVDGWSKIINSHPELAGIEFRWAEEQVEEQGAKKCPIWCECLIYRHDRQKPIAVREYLDEVYRYNDKYRGPWQTHTKRMLRHKALIQAARLAFSLAGIYDPDEAERVREGVTIVQGVEPEQEPAQETGALAQLEAKLKAQLEAKLKAHSELEDKLKEEMTTDFPEMKVVPVSTSAEAPKPTKAAEGLLDADTPGPVSDTPRKKRGRPRKKAKVVPPEPREPGMDDDIPYP